MTEQENTQSILEEFAYPRVRRRNLLLWWIKGFSLLFMITGAIAVISIIPGFFGMSFSMSVYGFDAEEMLSLNGIITTTVFILKGIVAWALWFEKDYAITLGEIDAVLGIVLCIASMFILPYLQTDFKVSIRAELLLLIPYLMKLSKIKNEWKGAVAL